MTLLEQPPKYVAGCPKLCFSNEFSATTASALITFYDAEPCVVGEMLTITGVKFTVGPMCDLTASLAATNAANLAIALNSHPDFFQRAGARVVTATSVLIEAFTNEFQPNWLFDFSSLSFAPDLSQNPGSNTDAPLGYRMHLQLFVDNKPYGPMSNVPLIYVSGVAINQCFEYKYPLMPEDLITDGLARKDYQISRMGFVRYGDSQLGVACGSDFGIFQTTNAFNLVFGDRAVYGGTEGEWQWLVPDRNVYICYGSIESRWIILELESLGYVVNDLIVAYDWYNEAGVRISTYYEYGVWDGDGVYQVPLGWPLPIPSDACYWHVFVGVNVVDGLGTTTIYPALGLIVTPKERDCKCVPVWYLDNGWKQFRLDYTDQLAIQDGHELLEIASDCDACKNKIARKELSENFTLSMRGKNFPEFRAQWYRFLASDRYLIHEDGGFKEVFLRPGETVVFQRDTAFFINIRFDR